MKIKAQTLLFLTFSFLTADTGAVLGVVRDANTLQPLVGANVMIIDTQLGDATDLEGKFEITGIGVGTRHLQVRMIGYETRVFLNLMVTTARPLDLVIEVKMVSLEGETVEVEGKPFTRSTAAVLSTMHVDNFEIRSDPGGTFDIQRMVQSLPSVTSASDQENEIITRGGMPGENLFLLDNIEIPNPNHFGIEGAGGGPINMINPLFVREIEFTPGAFSARYGDKASSVMDIRLREGSREQLETAFDLSMAGASINAEGPIADGKGAFLTSTTWSFLDLIVESIGMTAVPEYNNHQVKIVYDLSPSNRIILNALAGFDQINIISENEVLTRGAESVDWEGEVYVAGASLQTLLGQHGYGLTTLSTVIKKSYTWVYSFGEKDYPWFTRDNIISEHTLKSDWFLRSDLGSFSVGALLRNIDFSYNEWGGRDSLFLYDTSFWDGEQWTVDDPLTIGVSHIQPEFNFNKNETTWKMGTYGQWQAGLGKRVQVTAGGRIDYFTATEELVMSPRVNLELFLDDETNLHMGYGKHYQYPGYYLVYRDTDDRNHDLKAKSQCTQPVFPSTEKF